MSKCFGRQLHPKLFEELEECSNKLGSSDAKCKKLMDDLDHEVTKVRIKALESLGWTKAEATHENQAAALSSISLILHGLNDYK